MNRKFETHRLPAKARAPTQRQASILMVAECFLSMGDALLNNIDLSMIISMTTHRAWP